MKHNLPPSREIGIAEFKAKALQLLAHLDEHGGELLITKRGRQIARVLPVQSRASPLRGMLQGRTKVHGDLVSLDLSHLWEAGE